MYWLNHSTDDGYSYIGSVRRSATSGQYISGSDDLTADTYVCYSSSDNHTHSDNHIFIVVDGEVRIVTGDREIIAGKDQSVFVDGMTPHSIWNNGAKAAVVIKISTAREDAEV